MLKLKKGIYVYAQIKIDGIVKDFYVGKLDAIDLRSDAFKLDTKLDKYLQDNDQTHKFRNRRTVFGKFWTDLDKLQSDCCGATSEGRV